MVSGKEYGSFCKMEEKGRYVDMRGGKTDMKTFKIKIRILIIPIVTIFLSACGLLSNSSYGDMIHEDADAIMNGIQNKNYADIKEIFSPYVKETYPELENDIAELMTYIDGEIISYDSVGRTNMGGTSEGGEWVVREVKGIIHNIKTDNGKTYTIEFVGYANNKDNPNMIGVNNLVIISADEKNEEGYSKRKSIYYK